MVTSGVGTRLWLQVVWGLGYGYKWWGLGYGDKWCGD